MRFNEIKRWPGYASARAAAGLSDMDVCRWFGVSTDTIDDWHTHGAPVPVHVLFRYMADTGKRFNGHRCDRCHVLEVLRPGNVLPFIGSKTPNTGHPARRRGSPPAP